MNEAEDFFDRVCDGFGRAATRSCTQHTLCVGGCTIRLLIAGEGMKCLLPALAHLVISSSDREADLTLCLWDGAGNGMAPPPPPWTEAHYGPHGKVSAFSTASQRFAFDLGRGALYAWSARRKLALCWTHDARRLPAYERGAPLLPIWHWWLDGRGDLLLHAAAVGSGRGGMLIVGRGGSGKSTTALACLDAGMGYLGDDYCAVTMDGTMQVHSLFCTGKVHRDNLHRLPHLRQVSRLEEEDKLIFDLHSKYAAKLMRSCELRAVLVPALAHQSQTHLEPISPSQALQALAPSTLFQLTDSGPAEFERMSRLVRRFPCYRLWVGENVADIPGVLARLLEGNLS